jgi:hypothetical protein
MVGKKSYALKECLADLVMAVPRSRRFECKKPFLIDVKPEA